VSDRRLPRGQAAALVTAFSLAIFLNAALLFSVQPLFTKMVLPLLGGTPAVWNTCLLFFQTVLLAGYLYAHLTSRWLNVRTQAAIHLLLLVVAIIFLPIEIPDAWRQPPGSALPIGWLLGLLTVSIGLPFFLLSAGAPMMQRWFASSAHDRAGNPYFLYAASNLGSFVALLAYPFVFEPRMRISEQAGAWLSIYGVLLVLIALCGGAAWMTRRLEPIRRIHEEGASEPGVIPDMRRRMRWVVLSFVPSSLLIGVTTYLSTDVASVPFMWVVPLALYLLTFVLVFAHRQLVPRTFVQHAQLVLGLVLVVALCLPSEDAVIAPAVLHLLTFFMTAMMCHGELADSRPSADHLTGFYLWMSLGGVLGGVFNVLLAPILFDTIVEYIAAVALAFALRPLIQPTTTTWQRYADVVYPVGVFVVIWLILSSPRPPDEWLAGGMQWFLLAMMFVVFFFWKRPVRLGLGALAIYFGAQAATERESDLLFRDRSFFGTYEVRQTADFNLLEHGTTNHGGQFRDPLRRTEPLAYYFRGSPVSDVFDHLAQKPVRRVAIVGLGAGAIACYGRSGEHWTFYEIDPVVARIATTPGLFSYLRDCAPRTDLVIGDARLTIASANDAEFDVLILDAFSSDVVPAHLLTREAIALYLNKLKPEGALVLHVSSRFVDLIPVLSATAIDAGMSGAMGEKSPPYDPRSAIYASRWVVMVRESSTLAPLLTIDGWQRLPAQSDARVWTDDYTDILSAIKW
jgi:spermidine synthase